MKTALALEKPVMAVAVGGLLLVLSAFTWWLSTPLQWKIGAPAIPLTGDNLIPDRFGKSFLLESFGTANLVLAWLAFFCCLAKPLRKLSFFIGLLAIALCLVFLIRFALLDPDWTNTLSFQQEQYDNIRSFAGRYSDDANTVQESPIKAGYGNIFSKLGFCFQWISIGFYINVVAGILLISAARRFFSRGFALLCLLSSLVLILAVSIVYKNAFLSEYYRIQAEDSLYSGFPEKAAQFFDRAFQLNPNCGVHSSYVYHWGYADYLRKNDSSAMHFFKGKSLRKKDFFQPSLDEFEKAKTDLRFRHASVGEEVGLLIGNGLSSYKNGDDYAAIHSIQDAIARFPLLSEGYFFLGKIYLDIHKQSQSDTASAVKQFLAVTQEKLSRADAYNVLADSQYKSDDFLGARSSYDKSRKSFRLIRRVVNFNAMKGLQGL